MFSHLEAARIAAKAMITSKGNILLVLTVNFNDSHQLAKSVMRYSLVFSQENI